MVRLVTNLISDEMSDIRPRNPGSVFCAHMKGFLGAEGTIADRLPNVEGDDSIMMIV